METQDPPFPDYFKSELMETFYSSLIAHVTILSRLLQIGINGNEIADLVAGN